MRNRAKETICIIATAAVFFSGCSMFTIGDRTESLCDGECSFKKAGVCADVITIYKHRRDLANRKTKEHYFSKDEDPYVGDEGKYIQLNEEDPYYNIVEE